MQNKFRLFFLFFLLAIGFSGQPVYSQDHTARLFSADSLYQKGQYLKALENYRYILRSGQQYSPQMLLKMAFIEEALNHYTNSMYYLNLYYLRHPNRAVLKKMAEVAQANGLGGYEYHDSDFFLTQFKKYYMKLLEFLLIGAVVMVTFIALKPSRPVYKNITFRLTFLLYLAFVFVYINFLSFNRKGIIAQPNIALMAGPSAGAPWLTTLAAGNRLTITGEEDIWYEVKWKNTAGFVRKNNLLLLPD